MQAVSMIAKGEDSLASKINFDLCLCEGILYPALPGQFGCFDSL